MMEKLDAMNKDMFDEYVDGNGDGSATIQEIEMVSILILGHCPIWLIKKFQIFFLFDNL